MLFQCQKAKEGWRMLGLDEVVKNACESDHAGEAILEFLFHLPDSNSLF